MKSLANLKIPVILALAGALSLVGCKTSSSHLLSGKSYGTVDKEKAISANDLMGQSHIKVESELLGKVLTFKDLQAVEVRAIDTSKNACEYEFDATSMEKEKTGIQLNVQFNRTPNEIKNELRNRNQSPEAFGEIIPDTTLFDEINVSAIPDPLCKGLRIFGCTTNERADKKTCPFENGEFFISGKVFSVHRTSVSRMVIYILPTGYAAD